MGALREEIARVVELGDAVRRLEEGLSGVRAEERRLNEAFQRLEIAVDDLSKRSESRDQTVIYLEEQRQADNRRIAALEGETTELRKRIEATAAKMSLLEEAIQKQRTRIEDGLKTIGEFEQVIEELRVADFRRNQAMKKWEGQADEVHREMERLRAERQQFIQEHQNVKRALERLDAFQTRLEARLNEVAEMQRMAEDRLKRQWEEWQAAQEKERRRQELTVEERWRQQERTNQENTARLEDLVRRLSAHWEHIQATEDLLLAHAEALMETAHSQVENIRERIQVVREGGRSTSK